MNSSALLSAFFLFATASLAAQSADTSVFIRSDVALRSVNLVRASDTSFVVLAGESWTSGREMRPGLVAAYTIDGDELWRTSLDTFDRMSPILLWKEDDGWSVIGSGRDLTQDTSRIWHAYLDSDGRLQEYVLLDSIGLTGASNGVQFEEGGFALAGYEGVVKRYDQNDRLLWSRSIPYELPTSSWDMERLDGDILFARRQHPPDTTRYGYTEITRMTPEGEILWTISTEVERHEALSGLLPLANGNEFIAYGFERDYRYSGQSVPWIYQYDGDGNRTDRTIDSTGDEIPTQMIERRDGRILMMSQTRPDLFYHIRNIRRDEVLSMKVSDILDVELAWRIAEINPTTLVVASQENLVDPDSNEILGSVRVSILREETSGIDTEEETLQVESLDLQ